MRTVAVFILALLGLFTATAFAGEAGVMPDSGSMLDMLRPIWEAFAHGKKLYAGMLALVLIVAMVKRYAPTWKGMRDFVQGDIGGTLTALVGSFAATMAMSLAPEGVGASWGMVKTALYIAFGAAGGYTMIKRLVIEPIMKPLAAKAPGWMQPIFALVFWIFDQKSPVEAAEAAGDAAVEAQPPTGIEGVVGKAKEL